jgi:hypothetical protein
MGFEITSGIRHHARADCDGSPCPFHQPSLHPMIEEPLHLVWRNWAPVIERVCRHGHPDPDSVRWLRAHGYGDHNCSNCDGCCNPDRLTAGRS